jgi:hypothetical protein
MFDQINFGIEFFEGLERADAEIAAAVRAGNCQVCGGRLHRGDYDRKPRGGVVAAAGETQVRRFSFCCGREGCRRRVTPPSVRFLGRRVYLEAVVVVVSAAMLLLRPREVVHATGVPARTVRRWGLWWSGQFVTTAVFVAIKARFVGDAPVEVLPLALLERICGSAQQRISTLARWLSPLTTRTVPDGSRFVRGAV